MNTIQRNTIERVMEESGISWPEAAVQVLFEVEYLMEHEQYEPSTMDSTERWAFWWGVLERCTKRTREES